MCQSVYNHGCGPVALEDGSNNQKNGAHHTVIDSTMSDLYSRVHGAMTHVVSNCKLADCT